MKKLPNNVQAELDALYEHPDDTVRKHADMLTRHLHATMIPADHSDMIYAESGVSMETKKPFVNITFGSARGQLSPMEARSHALKIMEAAEASVQDAAIFHALTENDLNPNPEENVFKLISLIRKYRERFEGDEQ